jgi:hypothetical protein
MIVRVSVGGHATVFWQVAAPVANQSERSPITPANFRVVVMIASRR